MTRSVSGLRSVTLLLLMMLGLLAGSSLHKRLSYDEYPNVYYGYRFLTEGPHVIPDGQRMPVMALYALGCLPYQCDSEVLNQRPIARMIVRLPGFIFTLLLGIAIYVWVQELYGPRAALFSLTLYVFNPNVLAHGKAVTSDMATCLFFFLGIYFFWKYLKTGRWRDFLFTALVTAAAIVSKYSSLLIFGAMGLLWTLNRFWSKKESAAPVPPPLYQSLLRGTGFGLMVLFLINAAYLFNGTFTKTNAYEWQSKSYGKLKAYSLPVPFPKTFTVGMDYTSYVQENPSIGRGNNYILGKRHRRGRWYSFPIMILLKTPLAFFGLLAIAAFRRKQPVRDQLFLFIPFLLWLIIFSTLCDLQLGIRYVLPAFIFLLVYAGSVLAGNPGPKTLRAIWFLFSWYALSSLSYFPHFVSYFNEVIGNRINAYKYLSDSNLDWEDKSYWIQKFMQQNPELRARLTDGRTPAPGHWIVGANDYTGVMDEANTHWLRKFKPIRHIAYSHYLFAISPEKLQEALQNPS